MPAPTSLQRPAEPRTTSAIRADILVHTEALKVLLAELLEAETGRPTLPSGEIVSLKEAAHRTKWRIARLREHISRRAQHPEMPQLGYQPGDVANSPWHIHMDVLTDYIAGLHRKR
jgi:hypothetical protein